MKKNKTQLKKGKKNLRREIERILKMILYRGKEVSIPKTPLKIDGTGNISRLINKKGSVLPNETEMYGCEIDRSVPPGPARPRASGPERTRGPAAHAWPTPDRRSPRCRTVRRSLRLRQSRFRPLSQTRMSAG